MKVSETAMAALVALLLLPTVALADSFDVSGATRLPMMPAGEVVLFVGDQQYSASADDNGHYQVAVTSASPDDLVIVRICGADDVVCHYRLGDTVANLQAASSTPGHVELGLASPVSTAAYATVVWTLEGVHPQTASDIEQIRTNLEALHIGPFAATLLGTARGAFELPVGVSGFSQMVEDAESADRAIRAAREDEMFAVYSRSLAGLSYIYLRPGEDFPAEELLATTRSGPVIGLAEAVEFLPDNTGAYGAQRDGAPFVWENQLLGDVIFAEDFSLVGDNTRGIRIEALPDQPLSRREAWVALGDEAALRYRDLEALEIRALDVSEALPLGVVWHEYRVYFPEHPDVEPEFQVQRELMTRSLLHSDTLTPSWTPPQAGEIWAMPLCTGDCGTVPGGFNVAMGYQRATLNADGSLHPHRTPDLAITWQAGSQSLDFGGDVPSAEGWHLGSTEVSWLNFRFETSDSPRSTTMAMLPFDGSEFIEAEIPGRYLSVINQRLVDEFQMGFFVLHLEPGGTGWSASLDKADDPEPENSQILTWHLDDDGRLRIERYIDAFDFPFQIRTWELVRRETDRIYVIESAVMKTTGQPLTPEELQALSEPGRLNVWPIIELP